ncbi:MAG: hypothetical protein KAR20_01700 [Candidatus Heimdallarchaeota archaeon]|nr:hypothetical protein [Candidatus Heimdallarchaeota archaeon]
MKKINDIISEGSYKDSMAIRRIFKSECPPQKFKEIFIEGAKNRLYGTEFLVDKDNKEAINQLYYYLIGSDNFDGDPAKGIILMGSIGNGKTVLMESFIDVFNETSGKVMTNIHSKDIIRVMSENPVGYFNKRPLFIDDVGKEQGSVKEYGTTIKPMEDLINDRYKNFGLTFATSNYLYSDMSYSNHTTDRMIQMFNIIILPGNSRRK